MDQQILNRVAHLFTPQRALRFRWNKNTDTPLPPEEPAGRTPPEGALVNYYLRAGARRVTLEILDAQGSVVRRYASDDPPEPPVDGRNIPDYWIRPWQPLLATPGLHRFAWDLRLDPPATGRFTYPIAAIYRDTPREPRGPWVLPGAHTVRLTVDGQAYTQPLQVVMDPRVTASPDDLRRQFDLSMRLYDGIRHCAEAAASLGGATQRGEPVQSDEEGGRRLAADLRRLNGQLAQLLGIVQGADAAPTVQAEEAAREVLGGLDVALAKARAASGQ
jgi:hypothetical protein